MKSLLISGAIAAALVSGTALANSYSFDVDVDIQNNSGNLVVTQNLPVTFPAITVDGSTKIGATCHTNSGSDSLCRGVSAGSTSRRGGYFTISGSKYAPFNITLSGDTVVNGLKFTPSFSGSDTEDTSASHSLNSSGNKSDYVYGFLELVDPTKVETKNTVFNFNITATYE